MLRTSFQIVLGLHDATPVPAAARAHGFTHRFAIVQSTHAAGVADMVVDPAPLLVVLAALDAASGAPGRLYWDERRRDRTSLAAATAHYRGTVPENYAVISVGEWHRHGQLAVLLHAEQWASVGGPAPYHDSLTYSFYSAEDRSASLLAALRAEHFEPASILTVAGAPRPLGWFARLRLAFS